MDSSPLRSVLFIAGSLLLPAAGAGPTDRGALTTTDVFSVDAVPGSWGALRRALLAPAAPAPDSRAWFTAGAVPASAWVLASAGRGSARSGTAHVAAPASAETCTASGAVPGVHLALRVVAQQFGAPVTQLLDEYQAYRHGWQGRD